ncbi:MAG: FG-GAP-like repeat-containing protein, partial [Cytophagales bacterium]|nr:FG-GAP-like repeat-containing protein [Cytophagales bacterium]
NNIYDNANLGIYLQGTGNNNKPAPTINSAKTNGVSGTSQSGDIIQIFYDSPQSGTTDQGRVYLGQTTAVGTNWTFAAILTTGSRITATATDGINGTSPFSTAAIVTPKLLITSFTPLKANPGDALTILGADFGNVSANIHVFVGGVKATLTGVSNNLISCFVPFGGNSSTSIEVVRTDIVQSYSTRSLPINQYLTITQASPLSISTINFSRKDIDAGTPSGYYTLATGDLDGDGRTDLLISSTADIKIYKNISTTSQINFAAPLVIPQTKPYKVTLGDMDADGKLDIVGSSRNLTTPSLEVLLIRNISNIGSLNFEPGITYPTNNAEMCNLELVDFNKDNKADIAGSNQYFNQNQGFSVFQNSHSAGSFTAASFGTRTDFNAASLSRPGFMVATDLDGDGKIDVAISNNQGALNGPSNLSIFRNLNTGSSITGTDFSPPLVFPISGNPYGTGLKGVDLNNDGKPDLITVNNNLINEVYINNSTPGNLAFTLSYSTPSNNLLQSELKIADFDGDGKVDIVSAPASGVEAGNFAILKNTSSGPISFAAPVSFTGFAGVSDFEINDLNNDGVPEIIQVYGGNSSLLSIYQVSNKAVITSFSPTMGTLGSVITINGSNFSGINSVSFGGITASSFVVVNSSTILAVVGTGSSGVVSVVSTYGTSSLGTFTYF